jgi:hypothetical protein
MNLDAKREKILSGMMGVAVADAAALGLHWIYDIKRIKDTLQNLKAAELKAMERVSADFKNLDQDLRGTLMMKVMPVTKNHKRMKLLILSIHYTCGCPEFLRLSQTAHEFRATKKCRYSHLVWMTSEVIGSAVEETNNGCEGYRRVDDRSD